MAPGHFIKCRNGVVDLRSGEIRTDAEVKSVIGNTWVNYNPKAEHSSVDALKNHLREEAFDWLMKSISFSLRGNPTGHAYLLLGYPVAGKTTIMRALQSAIGDSKVGGYFCTVKTKKGSEYPGLISKNARIYRLSNLRESGDLVYEGINRLPKATLFQDCNHVDVDILLLTGYDFRLDPKILPMHTVRKSELQGSLVQTFARNREAKEAMLAAVINAGIGEDSLPRPINLNQCAARKWRSQPLTSAAVWIKNHMKPTGKLSDEVSLRTFFDRIHSFIPKKSQRIGGIGYSEFLDLVPRVHPDIISSNSESKFYCAKIK